MPQLTRRAALATTALLPAAARAASPHIDDALDTILPLQAETAVYNGLPDALNGGPLARHVDDYSPAGEAALRARVRQARRRLDAIPPSPHRDTARAVFDRAAATEGYRFGRVNPFGFAGHLPYVANQVGGPVIDMTDIMLGQQRVSNPAEADAYVAKLEDFSRGLSGVAATVRADARAGVVPPATLITRTLKVIDGTVAPAPGAHPLVTTLAARLMTAVPDPARRQSTLDRAERAIRVSVYPGYAAIRAALVEVAPRGPDDDRAGIWAQPRGAEFYLAQARMLGDARQSPAEIHELGLAEIARINAEMDGKLRKLGMTQGTVAERMRALAADPKQRFPDSDAGRAALLEFVRARVRAAEALYPRFLSPRTIPRQSLEVRRVPVAKQESAPGGYYDGPSLDGARPGIYWINLRDMAAVPRYGLSTLSFHEGVPGHHTQGAVALAQGDMPVLLRIASFNAYAEGWALYAERLAHDLELYRGDPAGDLGRLQDELFRAARLVVDTGLHALRWSRPKAIDAMSRATGQATSDITAEIERYMAWPGQALGYKIGQLRLLAFAAESRQQLGAKWDIRGFHDAVLLDGARPLDAVAASVRAWRART